LFSRKQHSASCSSTDEALSPLPQPFRSALLSMYNGEPQLGSDGNRHSLDAKTRISPAQGMWLYEFCRETKPTSILEIGLAYGYSTIYFLAAIRENGVGQHTAVDPFQNWKWGGIGSCQARSLGMSDSFRFLEQKAGSALTRLADRGERFEVIFIDGNHRFDDVLMDFTLSAELCPLEGCIILDDMWMPSIRHVVAFIGSNRKDFKQIKTAVTNVAAFLRIAEDTRKWDHYVEFHNDHPLTRTAAQKVRQFTRQVFVDQASNKLPSKVVD
jgi:predicted O-methyltransferase YrrM